MFYVVNMLNNWAFAFNIAVPLHIILRSFGSVTTMWLGWIRGKQYSALQVFAVMLLTIGVITSAWADAESKVSNIIVNMYLKPQCLLYLTQGKNLSAKTSSLTSSLNPGFALLFIAQLLSAYMGVYVQETYASYGADWEANLFYSHFLSLPLFLPLHSVLRSQYRSIASSPPLALSLSRAEELPFGVQKLLISTPRSVVMLLVNAGMQLMCISGVNLLSAKTSSLTVTIVLNVRKLVSFILSIYLFGNHLSNRMVLGATLVFGAGALYGWETSVGIKRRRPQEFLEQKSNDKYKTR